ncbi:hypothetical protein N7520_004673 [Penicillium odoratum]|uniref:uncharacterized protein n=1 Tax=Penicillium odoratum TaxID=1167516 RepID=UPI0025474DBF|nr:uncharacterized protein N7520_004673 [Penicillium odoratum]KAJ5765114.1 hypothetical protein N7520_004673 [Penicillium odoratum]
MKRNDITKFIFSGEIEDHRNQSKIQSDAAPEESVPVEEWPDVATEEPFAAEEPSVEEWPDAPEEPAAAAEQLPAEEEPSAEEWPEAAAEQPPAEVPLAEEPLAEEPLAAEEFPAAEESPAEEWPPAEEEPFAEEEPEAAADEPPAEEPLAKEPLTEEPPAAEESPAEEWPDVVVEEPANAEGLPKASSLSNGPLTDAIVRPNEIAPPITHPTETNSKKNHLVRCSVADLALYGDWTILTRKARAKRMSKLITKGLPVPGKDGAISIFAN